MRNILFVMLLSPLMLVGQSQANTTDERKMYFVEVVDAPATSKEKLFAGLKIAIAEVYRSAKDVSQVDDVDNGVILIKPLFKYNLAPLAISPPEKGIVDYTVKVDVKDNKYRISVYNFIHRNLDGGGSGGDLSLEKPEWGTLHFPKSKWKDIKLKAKKEADTVISSIKKQVVSAIAKSDDF